MSEHLQKSQNHLETSEHLHKSNVEWKATVILLWFNNTLFLPATQWSILWFFCPTCSPPRVGHFPSITSQLSCTCKQRKSTKQGSSDWSNTPRIFSLVKPVVGCEFRSWSERLSHLALKRKLCRGVSHLIIGKYSRWVSYSRKIQSRSLLFQDNTSEEFPILPFFIYP